MRKHVLLAATLARVLAALLAVLAMGSATGAVALASSHHRPAHHAPRHHRRHTPRKHGLKTRKTTAPNAHGQFIVPLGGGVLKTNQSNNWSGYNQGTLEQGNKLFNSIGGQWTVPTASQHTSGQAEYSADWIGIGGGCVDAGCAITDPTLIQTGTEQDVSSNGSPAYSAWWEVIPGPSLTISGMTIHPGDRMSASIAEGVPNSDLWTISLKDLTSGQSFSTTVPYPSTHDTAEWIQETPLILGTTAAFAAQPNLTSPAFDLATTNGAPTNLKPSEEIQLTDSNGNVIGTPSSPDPDADGFNICAWAGTCTAPGSS